MIMIGLDCAVFYIPANTVQTTLWYVLHYSVGLTRSRHIKLVGERQALITQNVHESSESVHESNCQVFRAKQTNGPHIFLSLTVHKECYA